MGSWQGRSETDDPARSVRSAGITRFLENAYHRLEMTPAGHVLQVRAVQSYRARTTGVRDMGAGEVAELITALRQSGFTGHIIGGWGVDALVGRQTRLHSDLDLAYEAQPGVQRTLESVLEERGFRHQEVDGLVSNALFPVRVLMTDDLCRSVDLHPFRPFVAAGIEPPPGVALDALPRLDRQAFVPGRVGRRGSALTVSCLAPQLQLSSRQLYELRRSDRHDIAVLQRLRATPAPGPSR